MVHEKLTPLEAVALAVRSEIESANLYSQLIGRVRNPAVKRLLSDLAHDEEEHREALLALYRTLSGGEEAAVPITDGRRKAWDLGPDADFLDIMSRARDKELDSQGFYLMAAEAVRDYKTRMFFIELADTERRHARVLDGEVKKLQTDPHWFDRKEVGDLKPVHEGP